MRLHYHEAGVGNGQTIVLLHGGGPGASSWSNFGRNIAVLAEQFHVLAVDQPGYGHSDKHTEHEQYNRYSATALLNLFDHLGIERADAGGQFAGRRHRRAVRAGQPRAGGPAGADGPRRTVASTCSRRTRPRASSCSAGSPPSPRARTWRSSCASWSSTRSRHTRTGRRALRDRQQPESLAAARAMGKSFAGADFELGMMWRDVVQAASARPADLGPRGPGQPDRRRVGRAQADSPGAIARFRAVRTLGAAGEVRRVQQVDHRFP